MKSLQNSWCLGYVGTWVIEGFSRCSLRHAGPIKGVCVTRGVQYGELFGLSSGYRQGAHYQFVLLFGYCSSSAAALICRSASGLIRRSKQVSCPQVRLPFHCCATGPVSYHESYHRNIFRDIKAATLRVRHLHGCFFCPRFLW